ncbi:MAG: REP-associated tyrosine transposase [bacterium]
MVRPLRINFEGAVHYITARGNERRPIFRRPPDYRRFLNYLQEAIRRHRVTLHAFVLMPNHFHLLLETPRGNLSAFMHDLNTAYTVYFNHKHRREGHLFRGRYKSLLVERETYLLAVSRYIHLNPVRAGLAKEPEDYLWCSYRAYMGLEDMPWLTKSEGLSNFGEGAVAVQRYGTYVEDGVSTPPPSPHAQSRAQVVLGKESFVQAIRAALIKRRVKEIPALRQLELPRNGPSVSHVVNAVADEMKMRPSAVLKRRKRHNHAKKIAMYVARDHAGLSLNDIADKFGVHYTSVSKHVSELRVKAKRDKPLYDLIMRVKARVKL